MFMAPDQAAPAPLVAISILSWNGWQDTLECLQSVRRLNYPNFLAVVVDNGSQDNSAERIKRWAQRTLGLDQTLADYSSEVALAGGESEIERALDQTAPASRLVLIRSEENLGFTGGNNVAIHYALCRANAADYVFLLNNDATADRQCVARLVSAARKAGAGIVGAVVRNANGEAYFTGSGSFRYHLFRPVTAWPVRAPATAEFSDSPVAYGAAMLVGRDLLERAHQLRGEYLRGAFFAYCEEVEFCWVAHRAGFQTVIANAAIVCHGPGKRPRTPGGSPYFFYYFTRNSILLARDVLPFPSRLAFHPAHLFVSLRRMVKRILAGQPQLALAIARGYLDGYRGRGGKWKHHDEGAVAGSAA